MSGYGNGYGNGGGYAPQHGGGQQARTPKLPQPGKGRLRKNNNKQMGDKKPDFRGFANYNGRMVSISAWFEPAKAGLNGPIPECFTLAVQDYVGDVLPPDPPRQQQGYGQPPQQQSMQYGAPPPQQQYAPQPATGYQPHPQAAPQPAPHGYPPQGGYVPTPSAAPQQAPQSGGYAGGSYGQQPGSTFQRDEIPF